MKHKTRHAKAKSRAHKGTQVPVNPGGPMHHIPVPGSRPKAGKPPPVKSTGPVHHPAPPAQITHRKGKVKPRTLGGMPCVAAALAVLGVPGDWESDPAGDVIEEILAGLGVDFWPAEPDLSVPGLILGLHLPEGDHAAVSAGNGLMWSWGLLMPVYGDIEEAWAVTGG